jgi:hypothetical protein
MQQRNHGFSEKVGVFPKNIGENFFPAVPYPLVTFRLKPFFSGI